MWFTRKRSDRAPARLGRLGEETEVGAYLVAVEAFGPFLPSGGAKPEEGLAVFAAEVAITNPSGAEPLNYRTGQWRLYDERGYVFEPVSSGAAIARKPSLPEGFLVPGTHVRGWVTFAVPIESRPARVQFFTGYLTAKVADFALPPPDEV